VAGLSGLKGRSLAAANFKVDLRGVVDLLARHLYSGPDVYLRELLQNAVDALTARRMLQPDVTGSVVIEPLGVVEPGVFRVHDDGIGLTLDEVETFLATIGRSSKRDQLDMARTEFLGRFGIGLLSAFLVSDEIRLLTRSARTPDAPTIEWRATSEGQYTTQVLGTAGRAEPGTTVELRAAPDRAQWLGADQVAELAATYGALLPFQVTVKAPGGGQVQVTRPVPWRAEHPSPLARRAALLAFGHETFGFLPFDVLDLSVPEAGLDGVGYVLGEAVPPTQKATHRVWLKGMLLGERVEGLLPEWAYFLRAAVDTTQLRPTASREALYSDELLALVRDDLGRQVREWLRTLVATQPDRATAFLRLHALGVKAMALHDDAMLELVLPWLPFETTLGHVSLAEFRRTHPVVRYSVTVDEFRRVAAVAAAQGLGVVNGGYTYDTELLQRIGSVLADWTVAPLDATVVEAYLDQVPREQELRWQAVLTAARVALDPLECGVELRAFDPVTLPALYLDDRDAAHERERNAEARQADELWASILEGFGQAQAPRARLVLNSRNPLVGRLRELADAELLGLAVESLYVQALLLAHRPLRPADAALLNRSYLALLDRAVGS
jgi:molecular chaperone HtpG